MRRAPDHSARRRAAGQSMIEYTVVLAIVVGIFALPFDGQAPLIVHFANAVGIGFDRFLTALSLPM